MSFAEKISSLMQRPNEDPVSKDEVPWWMKYAGRGLGTIGGGMAIIFGLWNCVGILLGNVSCLIGGMLEMVAGFTVIVIEAPCCCMFIDFVQNISDWVEKRPYWNKAVYYIAISIPPLIICFGLASLLGCGMIFGAGVIYGMMALGKKRFTSRHGSYGYIPNWYCAQLRSPHYIDGRSRCLAPNINIKGHCRRNESKRIATRR